MTDNEQLSHVADVGSPFARINRRLATLDRFHEADVDVADDNRLFPPENGVWVDDPDPFELDWAWIPGCVSRPGE